MRKLVIIILISFAYSLSNISISAPIFQFSSDYTIFRYNNSYVLEVYCSFYQKGLIYSFSDGNFDGAGLLDVSIMNKRNNEIVYASLNKVPSRVVDTSGTILEQRIVIQKNIPINSGEFILKTIGKDFNDTLICDTSFVFDLTIPEYINSPQISGIQLSSNILKSDNKESNFYKYGYEVIPNPTRFFGNKMNSLYYYYEIYGFQPEMISEAFIVSEQIENNNRELIQNKLKKFKKISDLMIDFDAFKVDSISTGAYYLTINVRDSIKGYDFKMEKKFYIYNSINQSDISKSGDADYLRSEYVVMKEDQIDDEFQKSIYIRTTQESEKFENLKTIEEKRKFMYNFWKTRNPNQITNKNEFKIQYFARIADANAQFRQEFTDGWKSDRGRIYLIYGKPNDVEKFPYEADSKSYEIWHYDEIEGGTICVFIELQQTGSGVFTLVHSTLRNELRNDSWQAILKK